MVEKKNAKATTPMALPVIRPRVAGIDIGGGTPTILKPALLQRLLEGLRPWRERADVPWPTSIETTPRIAADEDLAGGTELHLGCDDILDRNYVLQMLDALALGVDRGTPPWKFRRWGRRGFSQLEQLLEVLLGLSELDKEIRDVTGVANFLGELDDPGVWNQPRNAKRARPSRFIPVEANVDVCNWAEVFRPFAPEDARTSR